jgi:hypothetical protein
MSWGKGIVAGIVVFVLVVLVMVGIAMTRSVDLVTDGYYEKGVRYEERLASMRRAAALGHPVGIATEEGALMVRFDRRVVRGPLEGTITLYRPSRRESDQVMSLHPDSAGVQRVALAQCDRGLWRVQIVWRAEGEQYYAEEPLILQ